MAISPDQAHELAELRKRHLRVAFACGAFVGVMLAVSFAAVPLYDWFCRTTGFDGTPLIARTAPKESIERKIIVRFDANVAPGLAWTFTPGQHEIEIKVGETLLVHYLAQNSAAQESIGTATYNVSPPVAAAYFNKLECFCFTEQRLKAGERIEMPVAFFLDPAIDKDRELDGIREITLSYTFFPAKRRPEPVANIAGQQMR
ncbi:MAG TPA: cytochrome c oxidase assembly protein [Xanthobacteraceae bacterium]|jgi:cytochrome c oxidase assembly protein subunit 11